MELEFAPIEKNIFEQNQNNKNGLITSLQKNNPNFKNAHEIIPGLWLGNVHSSTDIDFHKTYNIMSIFNCTKDLKFPKKHNPSQKHFRLPVHDNLQPEEIIQMGNLSFEIVAMLDRELEKGKTVLVHCFAGAQRSAAVVAMYLIYKFNMTPQESILYIKKIRPQAFPRSINFSEAINFFSNIISQRQNKK
jgi:predicted protein tyrosine phosphatase